jgi:asparagine synthase (glutamine-hydrolysing)
VCGVAGIVRADARRPVEEDRLLRMARALRHRGPDGFGLARDDGAGFVSSRLAIFDLPGGWQPIEASPGGNLIVYNGEVYNHPELRAELSRDGAAFSTTADTEVVLRLLERDGLPALERLNGQFAFAWWLPLERRLVLVRDRFGVRPLHWAQLDDGTIVFASEARGLFASGLVDPAPDLQGIDEVFTLWGSRSPRTVFRGVQQLPPGGILVWEDGRIVEQRSWWSPAPWDAPHEARDLDSLLRDSVRLRLRADVPVGAYLSGGLDSSLISALAQETTGGELRTFSVAFADELYDERAYQEEVAAALGTSHHVVEAGSREIANAFPDVVRHAETPMVRTAPVPLYLLARAVREQGITVVATGEGADELFWGYDLFKEVALRRLHATDPTRAEELLNRLYPYLGAGAGRRGPAWQQFILQTGAGDDPLASHLTRVEATARVKAFYSDDVAADLAGADPLERLRSDLPAGFGELGALERASWLEVATLLEPYLLATQGDRMAMAHGVEGRYPFLDHRVFAASVGLPPEQKLDGLDDKVALRRLADEVLPPSIARRPKQPYRAPEVEPFFAEGAPEWIEDLLTPDALERVGMWDPARVSGLLRRCRAGKATGIREGMAFVGILSTQLWHEAFCGAQRESYATEDVEPRVRMDRMGYRVTGASV